MKSITIHPAEREIALQSVADLTVTINATRAAIEQQIIHIQAAAGYLVGIEPDPTKAEALRAQVRSRRTGIIAGIRSCRSGLLNLQCSALAAWEAAGEPGGALWERVAEWQVTMPADFLIEAVEGAMLTLSDAGPMLFAKYEEEECADPLLPESALLGEDAAFLETIAEALELSW